MSSRLCPRLGRRGTTPIEYAMIAALTAMVIITAAVTTGTGFERPYNELIAQFNVPSAPNAHANTALMGAADVK